VTSTVQRVTITTKIPIEKQIIIISKNVNSTTNYFNNLDYFALQLNCTVFISAYFPPISSNLTLFNSTIDLVKSVKILVNASTVLVESEANRMIGYCYNRYFSIQNLSYSNHHIPTVKISKIKTISLTSTLGLGLGLGLGLDYSTITYTLSFYTPRLSGIDLPLFMGLYYEHVLTGTDGVDLTVIRGGIKPLAGTFRFNVGGYWTEPIMVGNDSYTDRYSDDDSEIYGNDYSDNINSDSYNDLSSESSREVVSALALLPTINIITVKTSHTLSSTLSNTKSTITFEITFNHHKNWSPIGPYGPIGSTDQPVWNEKNGGRPAFGPMAPITVDTTDLIGDEISSTVTVIVVGEVNSDLLR
jgi:hypothetical protein